MKLLKLVPTFLLLFGFFPFTNIAHADLEDPKNYKVLSSSNKKLSIANVQEYITEGDNLIEKGDFEKAKETYDKARNLAKQLSGFYRDLNKSFRGLDARIPVEMDNKGRKSIKIWAESNSRLASLYIRKKQSEVAVPLLIEIIRLMSPTSTEGKKAYTSLIELGFVETPFRGS